MDNVIPIHHGQRPRGQLADAALTPEQHAAIERVVPTDRPSRTRRNWSVTSRRINRNIRQVAIRN